MVFKHFLVLIVSLFSFCNIQVAHAIVDYVNVFIDPEYVLSETFPESLGDAQETIIQWAGQIIASGPWSVLNKSVTPPSGDKHDYMSWAPYSWPNCTGVGNTTVLTPEEVWVTCPYVTRDGDFNPDGRLIDDIGEFSNLADAVLYNALAWVLTGRPTALYAVNVVKFIQTWFLDPETKMNPNLNYAQMARGPTGQIGTHTGTLDTKCFTKIITGILILKHGGCALWTSDIDSQMTSWVQQFVQWLETAPTAIQESKSANNHGSFYYTQLASLKLYLNDTAGALNATTTYFTNQFQNQILGNGEQPFEAVRTRPYHYRAYNLCAMITNARLQNYVNKTSNVWNWKTRYGATIQTALDFAMDIPPSVSNETSHETEIDPNVAAIIAVYGDPTGKYADFLQFLEPNYTAQPYWYWYQSLDSLAGSTQPSPAPTPTSGSFSASFSNFRRVIDRLTTEIIMAPLNDIEQLRLFHAEIRETFGAKVEIATTVSDESSIDMNEERELIIKTLESTFNQSIKLKRRLNKLVPVNRLPVDIFTHIIHLTNTSVEVTSHPFVSFTWVCHFWRLVLIKDPTFWTLIRHVTRRHEHPFSDELLRRSQHAELDIILFSDPFKSISNLKEIFVKESSRIRRLDISRVDAVLPKVLLDQSFPSLQGFCSDDDVTPFLPILSTSNCLESLRCGVTDRTPLDQLASVFSGIRNLKLILYFPGITKPVVDMLWVLNNSKVKKLQLELMYPDVPMSQARAVVLPELQYLSTNKSDVLKRFRAPKLSSLDVRVPPVTLDHPFFKDFNALSVRYLYLKGPRYFFSAYPSCCILGSKEHTDCDSSFSMCTKNFDDDIFLHARPRYCFHLWCESEEIFTEALRAASSLILPRLTNLAELHLLFKCTSIEFQEITTCVPFVKKLVVFEQIGGISLLDFIRLLRNTSLCSGLRNLSYMAWDFENRKEYATDVGEMLTECLQFRQKASVHALKSIELINVPPLPQKWVEELQKLGTEVVTKEKNI